MSKDIFRACRLTVQPIFTYVVIPSPWASVELILPRSSIRPHAPKDANKAITHKLPASPHARRIAPQSFAYCRALQSDASEADRRQQDAAELLTGAQTGTRGLCQRLCKGGELCNTWTNRRDGFAAMRAECGRSAPAARILDSVSERNVCKLMVGILRGDERELFGGSMPTRIPILSPCSSLSS